VRLGPFQYIEAPRPELYDLEKDPEERNNVVGADPGQASTLRTELANLLARYPRRMPAGVAEATPQAQKLLSLGYLAPGPRTRLAGSGPDPKDRLAEYRLYERSMDAVTHRRLNQAVALLTEILGTDPTNAVARRDLGSCQLDLHDYAKARANFEKLVVAAPDDYPSQFGLGMADKHLGLIDEARAHFEAACRIAPRALQCQRELDALKGRN
jgi:tetratricopeptide (TPR) repeat protein